MSDERSLEDELLHPPEQWYYDLVKQAVTQDPGPDRMGPYPTQDEAKQALELAAKRNEEWDSEDEDE